MKRANAVIALIVLGTAGVFLPGGARADTIVLSTADTAPFSTPERTGFYDQLLEETFSRLGLSLHIRQLPSERSLREADSGHVDGEFARIAAIAELYPNLFIVEEPLSEWHFSAFVRAGTTGPRAFRDLDRFHTAYIRGWKIYEENVRNALSLSIAADEEQLFSMLTAHRVDVILYNRLRGLDWMRRNPGAPVEIVADPLSVQPMYLFMHRNRQDLIPHLEETLREIRRDGTYEKLQQEVFRFVP